MTAAFPGFVISLEGRRYALARHLERETTKWSAAVDGDDLLGWTSVGRDEDTSEPDVWWLNVAVREDARERGIGGALYERSLEHALSRGARVVSVAAAASDASTRFATARG